MSMTTLTWSLSLSLLFFDLPVTGVKINYHRNISTGWNRHICFTEEYDHYFSVSIIINSDKAQRMKYSEIELMKNAMEMVCTSQNCLNVTVFTTYYLLRIVYPLSENWSAREGFGRPQLTRHYLICTLINPRIIEIPGYPGAFINTMISFPE